MMARQGQVGYKNLETLKIGDELEYSAGMEGHHIEARVTVTRKPGTTGVYVHVDKIFTKGELSSTVEGEEILAGATELFF